MTDGSVSSLSSGESHNGNTAARRSVIMSTATTKSNGAAPPRSLRSGMRAGINVQDDDSPSVAMKPADIVKIFTGDKEYIEVTQDQVERVKQMHKKIEDGVNFSFNYNVLLLVSSLLAGLGLISDNSTTIIASMLVSPLMGPVVGLAYGSTIRDWHLVRLSLRNECISLIFCIVVGLVVGGLGGLTWLVDDWPTDEMISRCLLGNLIVALPVAFVSGLGVAVSLFDDQMASLVGVAISASLLPPAVNAGIIWVAHAFTHGEDTKTATTYGAVSLLLTISNIILIWMSSMLMFRIKEVLPVEKSIFWSDLGIARKLYQRKAIIQLYKVDSAGARTLVSSSKDLMKEEECAATIIESDEEIEVDIEGL